MKINTKILQGLKEAQEPKVTLDQIIELLSNLGFNVIKDSTGVNNPTASAHMEEDVGYTKVAMIIDIADETIFIHGKCECCGDKSVYSKANFKKDAEIVIGDEAYSSVCRSCYYS